MMDSTPAPDPDSAADVPSAPLYAVRGERERLLEAMVRVSTQRGYAATTAAEVAAAAGLAEADFHRFFADKQDCFLSAYDAVSDVLIAHVTASYEQAEGRPWPDRIAAGLRALLQLLAAEAEITRMAVVEVTSFGEDARIRYRVALDRFVPFLEEGRDHSGQGDALPKDTAQFAIGGAVSMIFDEIRAGRGAELPSILPELAFAVLMPYLGAEAAEAEMERIAAQG